MTWIKSAFEDMGDTLQFMFNRKKWEEKQNIVYKGIKKMRQENQTNYDDDGQEYDDNTGVDEMADDLPPLPEPPSPYRHNSQRRNAARQQDNSTRLPPKVNPVFLQQPPSQEQQLPQQTARAAVAARPTAEPQQQKTQQQVDLNTLLSVMLQRIDNLEQDLAALIRIVKR